MIGGEPRTEWLADTLHRDDYGYLVIGGELLAAGLGSSTPSGQVWVPMFLETSMSGVFAVGDVRSGSVKRVAPSVGSGAIAVQLIHEYLARQAEARREEDRATSSWDAE
jgi:thioredoxin reductase (NADPH)